MKPPEHHFVNEYGQREVKRLWLGSGIFDRNGVEIFEGDIVRVDEWDNTVTVNFRCGVFCIGNGLQALYEYCSNGIEVVGHIAEDNCNG